MEITVEYTTTVIGGKEYQQKITRQKGLQEVMIDGKPTLVELATFIEWPGNLGTSQSYTIARPLKTPDEEAAFLARVREVATTGLINQGIW